MEIYQKKKSIDEIMTCFSFSWIKMIYISFTNLYHYIIANNDVNFIKLNLNFINVLIWNDYLCNKLYVLLIKQKFQNSNLSCIVFEFG